MAYGRKTAKRRTSSRRAPARSARRAPKRAGVRRTTARRGPQTVKIVLVQETRAGEGMGGMAMPQISTQNKRSKF